MIIRSHELQIRASRVQNYIYATRTGVKDGVGKDFEFNYYFLKNVTVLLLTASLYKSASNFEIKSALYIFFFTL
jgi:hypothetical protein